MFGKEKARVANRVAVAGAGVVMAASLFLGPSAEAAQVEMSSSLNPVGSGARAAVMGGAFIGVADDATAASWNPAGLVQLEKPEVSVVYGYFNRNQSYNSSTHPELAGSDNSMDADGINYASFVYPFTLKKNMVVSLSYQRLFDMNKELKGVNFDFDLGGGSTLPTTTTFRQQGYISSLTPAFAIQVSPELYLGVAVNIWDDDLFGASNWESTSTTRGSGLLGGLPFSLDSTDHTKSKFSGYNATAGFLVNVNKLTVGGVLKTPFDARVKQTTTTTDNLTGSSSSSTGKSTLEMPMSAGIGLAYRFSDVLSASLDGYWTQWSQYAQKDSTGAKFNPITTNPLSAGKPKDTFQARLGAEYLVMSGKSVIPLRAGVFYDPEPGATGVDDYYGLALGTGYTWENYSFDVAYQYRTGSKVTGDLPVDGVSSDVSQHTVLASLIYRF